MALSSSVSSISSLKVASGVPKLTSVAPKTPFAQVKAAQEKITSLELPASLKALEQRVLSGKEVKPAEILSAQVQMHGFNLKVELVSKGVEALTSSVKRLQQQQ